MCLSTLLFILSAALFSMDRNFKAQFFMDRNENIIVAYESGNLYLRESNGKWDELTFYPGEKELSYDALKTKIKDTFFLENAVPVEEVSRPFIKEYLLPIARILKDHDYEFQVSVIIDFDFTFPSVFISPITMAAWGDYLAAGTCVLKNLSLIGNDLNDVLLMHLENGLKNNNSVEKVIFINNKGGNRLALLCGNLFLYNKTIKYLWARENLIDNFGAAIIASAIEDAPWENRISRFSLEKNYAMDNKGKKKLHDAKDSLNIGRSTQKHLVLELYTDKFSDESSSLDSSSKKNRPNKKKDKDKDKDKEKQKREKKTQTNAK